MKTLCSCNVHEFHRERHIQLKIRDIKNPPLIYLLEVYKYYLCIIPYQYLSETGCY